MNQTRQFLNHLFYRLDGTHYMELTYIRPTTGEVETISHRIGHDPIDWDHMWDQQMNGYGAYYSLTTKRAKPAPGRRANERDTFAVPCLWVDIDLQDGTYKTLDDIYAALLAFHITPTTIIFSGGGYHGLWKITPIYNQSDHAVAKQTLRGLAMAIKGDTSVAELARVFRLPGTVNTKPGRNGVLCQIVFDMWDHEYCLADFAHYAELAAPTRRKPATPADLPPVTIPGYLKWFLTAPHPDGQRNNRLNWTAHKMYLDGFSLIDAEMYLLPRALSLGLAERESLATIRSPYMSKR